MIKWTKKELSFSMRLMKVHFLLLKLLILKEIAGCFVKILHH